jgi:hypothetical protein
VSSAAKLSRPFRVENGKKFRLKDFDPGDTGGLKLEKDHAAELLEKGVDRLAALQDKLYAQDKRALLLIFQAMDAAGKDGTIEHVMSTLYGWQRWPGDEHKSGWYRETLGAALQRAGFGEYSYGLDPFLSRGLQRNRMTRDWDAHLYCEAHA